MRKWAEVYQGEGMEKEELAALDVTDESDGGAQTMTELKEIYGITATYQWHRCFHDEGKGCEVEET